MDTIKHILEVKGYDLWTIAPQATVFDALRMMADKDVGALVVMDGDRLAGIISERDYARKVILLGQASREMRVEEIMSDPVVTIHPLQSVNECMALMVERHIRHLPVVDEDGVIGIISIGDVLRDVIYSQKESIKTLEDRLMGKTFVDK